MSSIPSSAMPHPHGDPEPAIAPANDETTTEAAVSTAKDAVASAKDAAVGAYGTAKDAAVGAYGSAKEAALDAVDSAREAVAGFEMPKPSPVNLLIGAAVVGGIAAAAFAPFFIGKTAAKPAPKRRGPARNPKTAARKTPAKAAETKPAPKPRRARKAPATGE